MSQLCKIKQPSRCVILKWYILIGLSCRLCKQQVWMKELPISPAIYWATCSRFPIPTWVFLFFFTFWSNLLRTPRKQLPWAHSRKKFVFSILWYVIFCWPSFYLGFIIVFITIHFQHVTWTNLSNSDLLSCSWILENSVPLHWVSCLEN